jgi:hypothetical protein
VDSPHDEKVSTEDEECLAPSGRPPPYTVGNVLRIPAGIAGIIALAVYVHNLEASWYGATISGYFYAFATVFWCFVSYLIARCFCGRFTSLLLSMVIAAHASCAFARPKCDDTGSFAVFGMAVALSAFFALGWLDRIATPFSQRSFGATDGSSQNQSPG